MSRDANVIQITEHSTLAEALGVTEGDVVVFTGAGPTHELIEALVRELAATVSVLVTTTTQMQGPPSDPTCPLLFASSFDEAVSGVGEALLLARRATLTRNPLADGRLRGLPRRWVEQLAHLCVADVIIVAGDTARGEALKVPGLDEPVIPACATLVVPVAGAVALDKPLSEGIVYRPEVLAAKLDLQFRQRLEAKHIARALVGEGGCASGAPDGCRVVPLLAGTAGIPEVRTRTIVYALLTNYTDCVIGHPGFTGDMPVRTYQ